MSCEECDAKDKEISDLKDNLDTAHRLIEELDADLTAYKKSDATAAGNLSDALSSLQDAVGYVEQASKEIG